MQFVNQLLFKIIMKIILNIVNLYWINLKIFLSKHLMKLMRFYKKLKNLIINKKIKKKTKKNR